MKKFIYGAIYNFSMAVIATFGMCYAACLYEKYDAKKIDIELEKVRSKAKES